MNKPTELVVFQQQAVKLTVDSYQDFAYVEGCYLKDEPLVTFWSYTLSLEMPVHGALNVKDYCEYDVQSNFKSQAEATQAGLISAQTLCAEQLQQLQAVTQTFVQLQQSFAQLNKVLDK